MKKISSFIIAIMLCISIVGCSSSTGSKSSSSTKGTKLSTQDSEIIGIVKDKIKAINNNKINDYMDYYDVKSPIYNNVKRDKQVYFSNQYSVNTSLVQATVLNKTKNNAQVQVVERNKVKENPKSSEKENGPDFLNNEILYVDYLKKIDGEWKITNESMLNTQYDDNIFDVIYKNVEAANNRKIDDYMDTFDSTDQNFYDGIKSNTLSTFNKYDVQYTLLEATRAKKQASDLTKDTSIYFEETCIDNKDPDYNNLKITGYYHLRIVNGEWKIFKIDQKDSVKVDAQGNEVKSK